MVCYWRLRYVHCITNILLHWNKTNSLVEPCGYKHIWHKLMWSIDCFYRCNFIRFLSFTRDRESLTIYFKIAKACCLGEGTNKETIKLQFYIQLQNLLGHTDCLYSFHSVLWSHGGWITFCSTCGVVQCNLFPHDRTTDKELNSIIVGDHRTKKRLIPLEREQKSWQQMSAPAEPTGTALRALFIDLAWLQCILWEKRIGY